MTGAAWGIARGAWRGVGDDVSVVLRGDGDDGERVRNALRILDDAPGPLLFLISYEACVALDKRLPRKATTSTAPSLLIRRVERAAAMPTATADGAVRVRPPDDAARAAHEARIHVARERLLDGVIYQANLAHKLVVDHASHEAGLAFFLGVSRARSPRDKPWGSTKEGASAQMEELLPPCGAFVDVPSWGSVISLSPERFVARANDVATTWPIKGTRPRGATPDEDARLLDELCKSDKDAAEHVMIVDLLRNDLGKVAVAGGVTVERLLDVVSVKNVHHLESTISARLRNDVTHSALLEATVPGGSITGAPKSSAVEVIHELEVGARGLYTGVLGFVQGTSMMSSLLIRTWLRPDDGEGSLQVGGGIVVDSVASSEWQETLDKARAFR